MKSDKGKQSKTKMISVIFNYSLSRTVGIQPLFKKTTMKAMISSVELANRKGSMF